MGHARLRVVKLDGGFIDLDVPVSRVRLGAKAQCLHFTFAERSEALRDLQILFEDSEVSNTGDRCRDGQRHGVAQQFVGCEDALLHGRAGAAYRLHAQGRDAALIQDGEHILLEAMKVGVEGVQRHLHGVKWESGI